MLEIVVPPVSAVRLMLALTLVPLVEPRRMTELFDEPVEVKASMPFLTNVCPLYVLVFDKVTVPPDVAMPSVPTTSWPLPVLFPITPVILINPPAPVRLSV